MQGKFTSSATVSERQIPVQMYRYKYRYEDVAEGLKYAGTTVPVQHRRATVLSRGDTISTLKLRYGYSTGALPYSAEAGRLKGTGISPRKERTYSSFAQRPVHEQKMKSDPTDKFQIRNLPQLFTTHTLNEGRRLERDPI